MLDKKLNIKDGNTIALIANPYEIDIAAKHTNMDTADVVLIFVTNSAELDKHAQTLILIAKRGAMVWLAYPKAKQLGTDLNRDIIWAYMRAIGLDAVRQVAIDDTWSALRFKLL